MADRSPDRPRPRGGDTPTFDEALGIERRRGRVVNVFCSTALGAWIGVTICFVGSDLTGPGPLPAPVVLLAAAVGIVIAIGVSVLITRGSRTERSGRARRISAAVRSGRLPPDADGSWAAGLQKRAHPFDPPFPLLLAGFWVLFGVFQLLAHHSPTAGVFWSVYVAFWVIGAAYGIPVARRNQPRARELLARLEDRAPS